MSKRRRYLLGISGGRDSVALLHILLENGYHNLILCHLNHGLRGAESGQDAAFVRRLAKKHNLPCAVEKESVLTLAKENAESIELAARHARHRFFNGCARTFRCNRILLAHHADDQSETVLFNLLRGSGGLKGMQFQTKLRGDTKGIAILRPLLGSTRKDITRYVAGHDIRFREDMSNATACATRNRLRNELLPLAEEIMGRNVRSALLRAMDISTSQETAVLDILDSYQLEDPQGRLFLPQLKNLPPALQSKALQIYLTRHEVPDIDQKLLAKCRDMIDTVPIAKINLPGGRHFRRKAKRLFIE